MFSRREIERLLLKGLATTAQGGLLVLGVQKRERGGIDHREGGGGSLLIFTSAFLPSFSSPRFAALRTREWRECDYWGQRGSGLGISRGAVFFSSCMADSSLDLGSRRWQSPNNLARPPSPSFPPPRPPSRRRQKEREEKTFFCLPASPHKREGETFFVHLLLLRRRR